MAQGQTNQSFNLDNQLVGTGFEYDGNGNAKTFKGNTVNYDQLDRMSAYRIGNSVSVGSTYRADGLRASRAKTVYVYNQQFGDWTAVNQTPTYFFYDGGEPILEMNTYGVYTNQNVFAPDGLVARKSGSTWTYYTFDPQGSVAQRQDVNGNVISSAVYDAYGVETVNGTAPTDPWAFNGQSGYYLDRDINLYLCQHRWYDQTLGRWLNRDPIGYGGGVNLYGYCGGGPVGRWDQSGYKPGLGYSLAMGIANALSKLPPWLQRAAAFIGLTIAHPVEQEAEGLIDGFEEGASCLVPKIGESAAQYGMRVHENLSSAFRLSDQYIVNRPISPEVLLRPDLVGLEEKAIIEFKPWTAYDRGLEQLEGYLQHFPGFRGIVSPYESPWTGPMPPELRAPFPFKLP